MDYENFVDKGVSLNPDNQLQRMLLGCMGLAGESGEVIELVKKNVFHGKELDLQHLKEELGDVLWYLTLLANTIGLDLEDLQKTNMRKLKKRYPERYNEEGN